MKKTVKQQRKQRAAKSNLLAQQSSRARLLIYKSNRTMYAQIIQEGKVICSSSGLKEKTKNKTICEKIGKDLATKAKTKKITNIVFDRNGYPYHGNVKVLADAARNGGLIF